jgi:ribosomal protein S18 acetylase RimI-like enzyme
MYAQNYHAAVADQEFRIRKATNDDMREIVDVHMASFRNFFLTFLGRRFLELLYKEIAAEPFSVVLVAVTPQNTVAGFAAGVADQASLYKRLAMKHWFEFGLASCPTAFRHPGIIPRLLRAFRYAGDAAEAACPALLMSLAVAPCAMSKGVGRLLVRNFISAMALYDVDAVCLKTDRENNDGANHFYRRMGFSLVREYQTAEGRWLNEYMIRMNTGAGVTGVDGLPLSDEGSRPSNRVLAIHEYGNRPKAGG